MFQGMEDGGSSDVVVLFPSAPPTRELRFRWSLSRTVQAGALARRRILQATAGHLDEEEQDVLRLLVSELVNNAVEHAGECAGDRVVVEVAVDEGRVRAEVWDGGEGFVRAAVPTGNGNARGRGLLLVDTLASRWGTSLVDGTRVWFELDRAAA